MKALPERFTSIRIYILKNLPFFGILSYKMPVVEDKGVPTACTNGREIRINPEWAETLSNAELAFVWAHEISHAAFHHTKRLRNRNMRKWNRACDYSINPLLVEAGLSMPAGDNQGLLDPGYEGMSADEIYLKIPEEEEETVKGKPGTFSDTSTHMDKETPAQSPAQEEALEKEWNKEIARAAKAAEAWGKLGNKLSKLVNATLDSRINWKAEMAQFIRNLTMDDYDWRQPNRRYVSHGLYLPRIYREQLGEIVVSVDTSGSTWNLQSTFMSEIKALTSECKPEKTWVIHCDAAIEKVEELDAYTPFQAEAHGGGGTSFKPPFEFVEKEGIRPVCMIYLTDLYGDFPEVEPDYPVLWITKGKTSVKPPFGSLLCIPAEA